MSYGVRVEVWGDFALFTRPETKVERVSYHCITPSAARGILEAIFWKPGLRYIIDRIHVLHPIRFTNIRRNEVMSKMLASSVLTAINKRDASLYISTSEDIQQRAAMVLRDVRYVIEAHFEMTDRAGEGDSPEKYYAMLSRRIKNGQYFHQPCLGTREFPAHFRPYDGELPAESQRGLTQDLGLMLYDMDYTQRDNIQPMFFHARLEEGVLDLIDCEVIR